jgi:hypothetical protein
MCFASALTMTGHRAGRGGKAGAMSPRTLAILFPDAEAQYWFTDRFFVVGDRLQRGGVTRFVTSVGESGGRGKHESITVRQDGDSPPSDGPP